MVAETLVIARRVHHKLAINRKFVVRIYALLWQARANLVDCQPNSLEHSERLRNFYTEHRLSLLQQAEATLFPFYSSPLTNRHDLGLQVQSSGLMPSWFYLLRDRYLIFVNSKKTHIIFTQSDFDFLVACLNDVIQVLTKRFESIAYMMVLTQDLSLACGIIVRAMGNLPELAVADHVETMFKWEADIQYSIEEIEAMQA